MATAKFNPSDYIGTNKQHQLVNLATGKVVTAAQASKVITAAKAQWELAQRTPIGVPKGYQVAPTLTPEEQQQQNAAYAYGYPTHTIGPTYFAGDESGGGVPGFPTDPDGIKQLQDHLVAIGYLKAGTYIPSQWNTVSSSAYAQLLAEANHSGNDWQTQLNTDLSAASKEQALQKPLQRTPLVVRLTDPTQIADTVNQVAKDLHGTYMSPDQLANFTAQYQQNEQQYQTQAYNATGFNPATGQQDVARGTDPGAIGADVVGKPPEITSAAKAAVIADNPNQFKANTFTDRLDEILGSLRGISGLPTAQKGIS
jgi:hypothetical protein